MTNVDPLPVALSRELERCRLLLCDYEEIGPNGQFGCMVIKADIAEAEKALAEMDAVAMLAALTNLKARS